MNVNIVDGKVVIDAFDLLHSVLTDQNKFELIESLSCEDLIIKHVTDQILDGMTDNAFSGSEFIGYCSEDSLTPLQKARREISKRSSEVAEKEISRLQKLLDGQKQETEKYSKKYWDLYHNRIDY